jgi:hypothetical protein
MTPDLNPFEPWRPPGVDRPAPPVPSQSDRHPLPAPQKSRPPVLLILGVGLAVLALIAFTQLPVSHGPRILAALLLLGIGTGVAITAVHKGGWRVRLSCLGAGVGLAVLAWWFVPTTGGLSLWSARRGADRLVTELEQLPAGDAAGCLKWRPEQEQLVTQFPEFRERLQQAADAWTARSVKKWQGDLGNLPAQDYAGLETLRASYRPFRNEALEAAEREWLERTFLHLGPGDYAAAAGARGCARPNEPWTTSVRTWEERWAGRTVDAAVADVEPLLKNDPARASNQLQAAARDLAAFGKYPAAQNKLLLARRQAFRSRLEAARREVLTLLSKDQYEAAADLAKRLGEDAGPEAQFVGQGADLKDFQDSCAFWAELSARAKQPSPK